MTFKIEIEGYGDYDYEPDFRDLIDALVEITDESKDYCVDNYEELVDGYYIELCEYFKETKADDIKETQDTYDYLNWYYIYGRNY